jgi:hypothetical protein
VKLIDKNQSWTPPEGYLLSAVSADGSYLRIEYRKRSLPDDQPTDQIVNIFLNDTGREVARTEDTRTYYLPRGIAVEPEPKQKPVTRWARFCNGGYLILSGFEEMFRCLSN